MPLLSLPCETLDNIAGFVYGSSPSVQFGPRPNFLSLSQTSRLLRSLSIVYTYSRIRIKWKDKEEKVILFLRSYPHLAACIRDLTIEPKRLPATQLEEDFKKELMVHFQAILESCPKLRKLSLCLSEVMRKDLRLYSFQATVLQYLNFNSMKSIKRLKLEGQDMNAVLDHFKILLENEFNGLETIKIMACNWAVAETTLTEWRAPQLSLGTTASLVDKKLNLVRKLYFGAYTILESQVPIQDLSSAGTYFARKMPNVQVLDMSTYLCCIQSTLRTYVELGSQLTTLTLTTNDHHYTPSPHGLHLCEVISKLSQRLTKFAAWELPICHKLFLEDNWPHIDSITISVTGGPNCAGIEPDQLRTGLIGLKFRRPRAHIFVGWPWSDILPSWFPDPKFHPDQSSIPHDYIASLWSFQALSHPRHRISRLRGQYTYVYQDFYRLRRALLRGS